MNRSDLVKEISYQGEMTQSQAKVALTAVLDSIEGALSQGDKVSLVGFGSFGVKTKASRKGRNPKTGEEIEIGVRTVMYFKPSKELCSKVNV
jgi:DNA-binding protein HU-beta